jgi:Ferritin-like domain
MFDTHALDRFDRDGALQETREKAGVTRLDLLRRGAIGGGALVATGALFGPVGTALAAGKVPASDVAILNYALTLEYLEAAFYNEGVAKAGLSGSNMVFAKTVAKHENAHVAFLKKALGAGAVKKPAFKFGKATTDEDTFLATAMALEDTGVAAYAGQGPLIKTKSITAAALSIHSVEARHAAWIRTILGKGGMGLPAPVDFDAAKTMKQVLAIVKGTGFIVS